MSPDENGLPVADVLARLGGADLELLRKTSEGRRQRFVQMALTLIGTAAVAGLSMWYAMFNMVVSPQSPIVLRLLVATVLAAGWALLIFNLDRVLVLSMSKNESIWLNVGVAVPRLLMALLIGAVVSTPLTLQLFQGDIMKMVTQQQLQDNASRDSQIASSNDAQDAEKLKQAIADQQSILNGKLPASSAAPQVQAAQAKVDTLNTAVETAKVSSDQANLLYQCDRYGDPTGVIRKQLTNPGACADKPGPNGLASRYQAAAQSAAQQLASLTDQRTTAIADLNAARSAGASEDATRLAQLQAAAPGKIKDLQAQLAPIQGRIDAANARWDSTSQDATGILARLDALDKAAASSSTLWWAQRMLWATFAMIEILPVTVKLLTLFGKPTSYDIMSRLQEEAEVSRAEILQRDELDALENDQLVRQDLNQDMLSRERTIGLETNELLEGSLRGLSEKAAKQWEAAMTAHFDSSVWVD